MRLVSWNIQQFTEDKLRDNFVKSVILKVLLLTDILVIEEVGALSLNGVGGITELYRAINEPYISQGVVLFDAQISPDNAAANNTTRDAYAIFYKPRFLRLNGSSFPQQCDFANNFANSLFNINLGGAVSRVRNPYMWEFTSLQTQTPFRVMAYHAPEPSNQPLAVAAVGRLAQITEMQQAAINSAIVVGDFNITAQNTVNAFQPLVNGNYLNPLNTPTSLVMSIPTWETRFGSNPYDKILYRGINNVTAQPRVLNLVAALQDPANGWNVPYPGHPINFASDALYVYRSVSDHLPVLMEFTI